MTRKEIEEGTVMSFAEMINDDGVKLIEKKFSGDHYADFEFFVNELRYKLSIVFIKPHFIKPIFYLKISSKNITDLINTIIKDNPTKEYFPVSININSYLVPQNRSGIYQTSDKIDFYLDEEPIESKADLERITKDIFYDTIYKTIKNEIIPKADSLEKIDYLFNDLPFNGNIDGKPKINTYTTYLINQVLTGTLLAIEVDRKDRKEIFEKYLKYASKFEDGQKESIDLMRKAIKMYS
jgi:hypothetical protein